MCKGMSIDECVELADNFIRNQGMCLLCFDVKNSRGFKDSKELVKRLNHMMNDINQNFANYFPEQCLANYVRVEKGFQTLLGDGSWAGINSSEIIPKIIEYQKNKYSNIPLYWGVARDGFDCERIKLLR